MSKGTPGAGPRALQRHSRRGGRRGRAVGAAPAHPHGRAAAGLVCLTWITSGFLYLNPGGSRQGPLSTTTQMTPYSIGGVRASTSARPGQAEAMRGGPLVASLWVDSPAAAWERVPANVAARQGRLPREVELHRFAGRPYYAFLLGAFESVTVAADDEGGAPFVRYPTEVLVARRGRPCKAR